MDVRRLLLFSALLLLGLSFLGAASSTPRGERAEKPQYVRPAEPAPERRGELPEDERVHVKLGDVLRLTVSARQPDTAAIPGLGLEEVVEPGAPAEFTFVADRSGRFPVSLTHSGREAGVVLVTAAGPEGMD